MTDKNIVLCEIDNRGIANIYLNRPHKNNAYNGEMIERLLEVFEGLSSDKTLKAVVIRGNGKHFQAGADLGMYEDVAVSEPSDDLQVRNKYIDLPSLDFPSYEKASQDYKNALLDLKKIRELGNKDDIKKMVSTVKRTNFTRKLTEISKGGKVNIWIQTIKVGDIIFQGLPLEPFMEFSHKIKSLNSDKKIFWSGYTNGWLGYLPTAKAYEEGGYETRNTPLSPESEELILDICDSEIKKLD